MFGEAVVEVVCLTSRHDVSFYIMFRTKKFKMIGQETLTAEAKPQPQPKRKEPPADDENDETEKKDDAMKEDQKKEDEDAGWPKEDWWTKKKGDDKDWVVAKKDDWQRQKKDKGYGKGIEWVPQMFVWCRQCGKKMYVARSSPLRKQGLRHCQNHMCNRWQHYKPTAVISTGNKTPSIHSVEDDDDEKDEKNEKPEKPDELTGSLEDADNEAYWDSFLPDEESDQEMILPDEDPKQDDKPEDDDDDGSPKRVRIRKKSPPHQNKDNQGQMFSFSVYFSLTHTR